MSLALASILGGLACICLGLGFHFFLKRPEWVLSYLRNQVLTLGFYSLACFWFLYKVLHLGEADFGEYRHSLACLFVVLACLAYYYVPDFLLIRSFAILGLLSADVLLDAAYMQPYALRLGLVIAVYIGIIGCLLLGALPYLARRGLLYLKARPKGAKVLAYSLVLYGCGLGLSAFVYCG